MKYLLTILSIACIATAIALSAFWPDKQPEEKDIAVTINGHSLARSALEREEGSAGYHRSSEQELMESAITRELLLQEAQRQAIDKEPNFRAALKSFYEQSLIKVLLDRQYQKTDARVSEEEISAFLSLFGKKVTFSRLSADSPAETGQAPSQAQQMTAIFDDLAEPLQVILSTLKPGESAVKYDTGSDQYTIRLEDVSSSPAAGSTPPDRETVRQRLAEYKREQQMSSWLNNLKKSASITIHNK
ncbi:MAG: hypothetical protein F9K32_10375 [Desulfobulbaceae bacterium]|nr:MAG: hypothetical protein F9K32_10375 [Desulfobulbaceae bacterium]